MNDPLNTESEPANLRLLRVLVTVLTTVMIGGLLVIVALFVIRFSASAPVVPQSITLPDGVTAESFTMTPGWYAVVVDGGTRILIFDRNSGELKQTVNVNVAGD
ncbi:DUF6476 family protein [Phaeobacter sp. 22II1-1F12B]|uniref:DUF6476 family protein n=1 Tax=Phaeobacter sp. 22II1-1F12B TaxID=1317111 RepID=UPI000B523FD7|nr:DUF6476 family protein [Phaeobacter sp. 22II1-1F12B]OWU75246.1 hypothetical protein ATO1_18845 [Phaeobacter sp. 22II1-1F12B]